MRHYPAAVFLFLIIINISITVNAEYVFKKDGAIIKGKIVSDDPSTIVVKDENGGVNVVYRKDLLRILYTDLYMGKVFVRLTSGEVIEGYQVDEDRDVYVFRKEINNPSEFKILRKKVMFIARTNPTDLAGEASIDKISIKWSPPFKPAKLYKVYMRQVKKDEKFKVIGETDETAYLLKKLARSASYEIYVTAIGDTGEESLPSEKIITNTIPYPPEDLAIAEKYSQDGKSVTLTMTWSPVIDAESRVKSYAIYKIADERKKLGTTKVNEFVIKDFPAEGRHWFSVVSVNDLDTESADVKAVYDAGFIISASVSAAYLVPSGDLGVIADSGYGALVDFNIGAKALTAGFETGYFYFNTADKDIKNMGIIPLLLTFDYSLPLFFNTTLKPVIKAGTGYSMIEYIRHLPLKTETYQKNEFNPLASLGTYIDFRATETLIISGGLEYSMLFQKNGTMNFMSCIFGAGMIF